MHFYWNIDYPYVLATVCWVAGLLICEVQARRGKVRRADSVTRIFPALPVLYTLAYVTSAWIGGGKRAGHSWLYVLGEELVVYGGGWNLLLLLGTILILDFLGGCLRYRLAQDHHGKKQALLRRLNAYTAWLWTLPPVFWLCYVTQDWGFVRDYTDMTWFDVFWYDTITSKFGLTVPVLFFCSAGLWFLGRRIQKILRQKLLPQGDETTQ